MSRSIPIATPILAALILLGLLGGCTSKKKGEGTGDDSGVRETRDVEDVTVEVGDLEVMKKKGTLRILVYGYGEDILPRAGASMNAGEETAVQLAQHLGLEPQLIAVERFGDLIPALLEGKGDLIAARLSVTKARKEKVAFTRAVTAVDELLVARADDTQAPKDLKGLVGKTVTVRASSAYRESLDAVAAKDAKGVIIKDADEGRDTEKLVHDVASGTIPYTVADSDVFEHIEAYEPGVTSSMILKGDREIAFAVRPTNPQLKTAADAWLIEHTLAAGRDSIRKLDLTSMKKRGSIRVLTRNNAVSYFLYKGLQQGFDYEFISLFAKEHGLRVDVVVPPEGKDLIPWLNAGRGDVIAAGMTITPERQEAVWFSPPYNVVDELLVMNAAAPALTDLKDLKGKTVHVRKSSTYRQTLDKLQATHGPFTIVDVDEHLETEELLDQVGEGKIDLTVADSTIAAVELAWRSKIQTGAALAEGEDIGLAARRDAPELQAALNAFVVKHVRKAEDGHLKGSTLYNILKKQYFESKRKAEIAQQNFKSTGTISDYDDVMKSFATKYGLDWRLMAAQAYQESRFDPNAKSWVGAQGLFQVMPRTGAEMGFHNLKDPEEGTHAGVRYMAQLIDSFDKGIPFKQRVRFALASYNAGRGHVEDARRLAKEMGRDPDRWFKNVEDAMVRLQDPAVAKRMRHGYCRGEEPVKYVSQIQLRYENFLTVIPNPGIEHENVASDAADGPAQP